MEKNNILGMVIAVSTILAGIAVGGLFLDGTTLANPILGIIPDVVHKIVGWFVMGVGILSGLRLFGVKI